VTKRAIEESFPIVEINRLAIPERNAFKPIYQMHKWFARRASSVFRAILLASMKPAGTDIMEEFYKDHTHDLDTNGVKILDPFMGGGTTVIEALRLGCYVTAVDLNPVAWFVVKTEAEPVNLDELRNAFKRLEEMMTASGKPLKEELLSHYKTECPCCAAGEENADTIYTFWVKSAICTDPNCKKEVPLFSDYIICKKSPSTRYIPDYQCSHCNKEFDLDLDKASLIAENNLTINSPKDSSGDLRSNKRWTSIDIAAHSIECPWCKRNNSAPNLNSLEKKRKKVPLSVLLCPHCNSVWQYRGDLPENVNCPVCKKAYAPLKGNIPSKGKFICPSCGNQDKIINSIRKLPHDRLLPSKPYALEGYCTYCAGNTVKTLFGEINKNQGKLDHSCYINKNNGKFFKRITPSDLKRYQEAEKRWELEKDFLPYPKSAIPRGEKTKSGLIAHHYIFWRQMFNSRQLLCLSTLIKAIDEEENSSLKEMLLSAFYSTLESNNVFCRYTISGGNKSQGIFSRHDYQPKNSFTENNTWGSEYGHSTFSNNFEKVLKGKEYCIKPYDRKHSKGESSNIYRNEIIATNSGTSIDCGNSMNLNFSKTSLIITDPPYAGNVNYSELADFFYVWLRLVLSKKYLQFSPDITPKAEEIIENPTRGKTFEDYQKGLTEVWKRCHENLDDKGLMVFTFHHSEGSAWEALLESLCNAGFFIEAIYPIHGESESSLHLQNKQAISYDLIHVCKKQFSEGDGKNRSWASVRREIRKKAREEIKLVEAGRYGKERLSEADISMILIGKCLELYSKYYGLIVGYKDEVVPLHDALKSIKLMVEQILSMEQPLPSELEYIDPVSYVYLTCLCDRKEIKSDEVHKATRGILEPTDLTKAGIMRKGRAKRGRTYEIKHPSERYKDLQEWFHKKTTSLFQASLFPELEEGKFDNVALVDIIHFLMGLALESEDLIPWFREFESAKPQFTVALEYLKAKNPTFQEPINKILNLIEV